MEPAPLCAMTPEQYINIANTAQKASRARIKRNLLFAYLPPNCLWLTDIQPSLGRFNAYLDRRIPDLYAARTARSQPWASELATQEEFSSYVGRLQTGWWIDK
jgi:hypothetical protein